MTASEPIAGGGAFVSIYHGSINNGTAILRSGLDPSRGTTFVTRDRAAAADALANHYDAVRGAGTIIESRIPAALFDRVLAPLEFAYKGFYPYAIRSTEIGLRTSEEFQLWNRYIVK